MATVEVTHQIEGHAMIGSHALDGRIGKTVRMVVQGEVVENCTIVGAAVAEDGRSVTFTIEVPDVAAPAPPVSIRD